MRTVRDRLRAQWEELQLSPEQVAESERAWLEEHIAPALPERYRRLAEEVLWRLPDDWDRHAIWHVELDEWESLYGSAVRLEQEELEGEDPGQHWRVGLSPALLDRLSDAACRWVIAHELAHVASGIPTGVEALDGKLYTRVKGTVDQYQEVPSKMVHEDAADQIALEWGFSDELQAWLAEDE